MKGKDKERSKNRRKRRRKHYGEQRRQQREKEKESRKTENVLKYYVFKKTNKKNFLKETNTRGSKTLTPFTPFHTEKKEF